MLRSFSLRQGLTALALGLIANTLAAEEPPALDPQAVEILREASAYLSDQPRVAVDWFVSYDEVIDGREKLTRLRSGTTLLDREQGFYSYVEAGPTLREFFFDGSVFSVFDPQNNAFARTEVEGTFEILVDRVQQEYGLALPIWQVLSKRAEGELLSDATSAAYVGLTRVAGDEAHHLAFANYEQDWQVWISTDADAPILLMLVGTDPYTQGWPQFRAYFTGWDFAPEMKAEAFAFEPPEDAEQMVWPRVGVTTGQQE
ncbi:DUF2092 domain-containing protein [Lutimaribacter marinistellae]|uniref:DUF2092 domain-containing protein n=1 Tax=Lutimaribacter marinistellae TaxID=1820329 RepID=A0ABV7THA0_9RHOB